MRPLPAAVVYLLVTISAGLAQPRVLSIEKAYALSETNAESLKIKSLQVQKSRYQLTEARARALPRLSLEASGSYLANPPEGVTVKRGELGSFTIPFGPTVIIPDQDMVFIEDAEHTYFKLSATLAQPVFTWGKISGAIRMAGLALESSRAELEKQRSDLRREVHRAYFSALLSEGSLALLARMQQAGEEIVADRERSYTEGLINLQELLEAQANYASVVQRLTESQEGRQTALETLRLLTGLEANDLSLSSTFRGSLPEFDEDALKERAVESSEELRAARLRLDQTRAKLQIEKGGGLFRPDFSLAVTLDVSGQRVPFVQDSWQDSWNWDLIVGLGTKVNVLDSGVSSGRIGQARMDMDMAGLGLAQTEKLIRMKVRQAVQELRATHYQGLQRQAKLKHAEEQIKNARVAYESGLVRREELKSAELALYSANLEALASRFAYEQAVAELEYLTGESF